MAMDMLNALSVLAGKISPQQQKSDENLANLKQVAAAVHKSMHSNDNKR